jgi:hypothetical protein
MWLDQTKPGRSSRARCTFRTAHASGWPSTTRSQLQLTTHLFGHALLLLLLLLWRQRQRRARAALLGYGSLLHSVHGKVTPFRCRMIHPACTEPVSIVQTDT